MNVIDKIISLRSLMQKRGIDGYLIYGTDPHLSEYVPDAWRTREWITGFTGSYGKVAITENKVALWTDSRYFIQAVKQLSGTGIELIKDRQPDTVSIDRWLEQNLQSGGTIAMDGLSVSEAEASILEQNLAAKRFTFDLSTDLVGLLWINRPKNSQEVITDYPVRFAGSSRAEKLSQIRKQLTILGCEATLIGQLDDLAWCFNLRGNDISYNPLFTGYGYIDQKQALLFVDENKVTDLLKIVLEREGVRIINYESIFSFLKQITEIKFFLDSDRTNSQIYRHISRRCKVLNGLSLPTLLKSIKNEVEIAGMRDAHYRDGLAMVNFFYWFDEHFGKEKITELSVAEKLREFRSGQENYMGESFCPIVASGVHGAIVHYSATSESDIEVLPDDILLIDTGGQYLDGTTDITRTIATGKVTDQQQSDFTLVLKGMIQLAMAIFPENTKGHSLDILARNALWNNGLNYGHGTGHGVGHYLSVHEGPMSIRQEFNNEPIRSGQFITDEPGLYREGNYGIRIENVLLCRDNHQSDFGNFFSFDVITLCPIDKKLVDKQLLSDEEVYWLNAYHTRVFEELESHLNANIRNWLKRQCSPI